MFRHSVDMYDKNSRSLMGGQGFPGEEEGVFVRMRGFAEWKCLSDY